MLDITGEQIDDAGVVNGDGWILRPVGDKLVAIPWIGTLGIVCYVMVSAHTPIVDETRLFFRQTQNGLAANHFVVVNVAFMIARNGLGIVDIVDQQAMGFGEPFR